MVQTQTVRIWGGPLPTILCRIGTPSYNEIMTPMPFFSAEDPVSLAGWLLEEISRGMIPVWPSTRPYAERMAEGLAMLHPTRRREVMEAVEVAPDVSHLDWSSLLAPILIMDGSAGIQAGS